MSETTDRSDPGHLSEDALVSLAEGGAGDERARRHLETCEACRARLESTRAVLGALASEPPMPDEETFTAQRERIMEAIDARRRPAASIHPVRVHAWWWVPLAAAAALAVVLLTRPSPDGSRSERVERVPTSEPSLVETPADEAPLPVLAEADRAVDEATRELARTETAAIDRPVRLDSESIDLALEDLEATDPVLSAGTDEDDRLLLEERFAALSSDEQEAILDDLSTMALEL